MLRPVSGHGILEGFSCASEPRANRAKWDPDRIGDLVNGHFFDLEQDENGSQIFRHALHHLVEQSASAQLVSQLILSNDRIFRNMRKILIRLFSAMYRATRVGRNTSGRREQEAAFFVDRNFIQFLRSNQEHLLRGIIRICGGHAEAAQAAPHEVQVRGRDATQAIRIFDRAHLHLER